MAKMIFGILNSVPWLLLTFTLSESLTLNVTGSLTADCGKPVTLHCEISSSLSGLSVKYMNWSQSQTYCSVDSEGHLTAYNSSGDFLCHYEKGHLSLHFNNWQPQQSESSFLCKVHSNQGIRNDYTRVKTRENWEGVEALWDAGVPTCIFRHVCPEGEVDWFQDSKKITNQSFIVTKEQTRAGRSFTIYSYLKKHSQSKTYKCSLRSVRSGQHLTSAVIQSPSYVMIRATAAAHAPLTISLGFVVGLIVDTYYH
ncbi:hypothetical protein WMY93_006314 [Mugilogobius chulae]|uniref:Ig-like domain-containing protein n=1 Tax=Mugilogobius chulae TaxID=88201 RepID=A0AAW0PVC3_9GOBI